MEHLERAVAKLRTDTARAPPGTMPQQTWGAEMEFLLYWRQVEAGECPGELARRYPGVVLVPAAHRPRQQMFAARCVARHLREANELEAVWLEDSDGCYIQITRGQERAVGAVLGNAAKHAHWLVMEDPSVHLRAGERTAADADLGLLGIEVVTPVLANCNAAFREFARILRSLASFRTRTNVTTGLHVHVGYGRARLGAAPLRSIAAVLFASDVVLKELDRPARHAYSYSLSTRALSNAALGMTADEAERWDQRSQDSVEWRIRTARGTGPVGLTAATSELLQCQTLRGVAQLMAAGRRPVFSFENYGAAGVLNVLTIEFRQKEGTLDAHVITAWTQICLRLVEIG